MSDELKMLEDMLSGFEEKGKALAAKKDLFIKAQGLDEAIERNRKEKAELEDELQVQKDKLKELKEKKKQAVDSVAVKICAKLDEFLPVGGSFFDASDALSFGWIYDGIRQPYNSLSGGQKVIFDTALNNLLGSNIMILEAAELDHDHLSSMLEDCLKSEKQVFVNTCHDDFLCPKDFEKVVSK